ncbi:hypothetical protein SCUCBS95973_001292 [Sporothrix curviconia]|uniref:Myb-like domain-containing protein n=1 Tax=Sporothrix curviconia TaxID=1260050 RepID=A0ABP0AXD0_9PEZI
MATPRHERPTTSGRRPADATPRLAARGPQTANHHETLDLQVSLWPTFQPAKLPEVRDPGRPKVRNVPRSVARGRRGGKGQAWEVDILEQVLENEGRLRNAVSKAKSRGEWRRMWQNLQQMGDALACVSQNSPRTRTLSTMSTTTATPTEPPRKGGSRVNQDPTVLQLPHAPAPLPPCLQCVLAGTCCSLTVQPYAKAFANDTVSTREPQPTFRPPPSPPPSRRHRAAAPPSPTLMASQLARLSTMASVGISEVEAADVGGASDVGSSDWELATSGLPWKRQHREQKLLREAVVRGSTDSPFLAPPPVQCARCKNNGEAACLQQSRDITNMAAVAASARDQKPVAWFASSGPPPLSLLPQHNVPLLDQIRFDPLQNYHHPGRATGRQGQQQAPGRRLRSQNQPQTEPRPVLEAVFCRDPKVLSASGVASRAQDLLEKIERKYPRGASNGSRHFFSSSSSSSSQRQHGYRSSGPAVPSWLKGLGPQSGGGGGGGGGSPRPLAPVHVRPATKLEVSRLLPQRSWMNVYAGRGVATAATVAADAADVQRYRPWRGPSYRKPVNAGASAYRAAVPPALPAWHANNQEKPADASGETYASYRHKWQDHFLNVGEDRAARQMQRDKQQIVKRKPLARSATVSSHTRPVTATATATITAAEPTPETSEQRHAKIAQMALSLGHQFRERRAQGAAPMAAVPVALQPQHSSEMEVQKADLINTLTSWLEPEQAHQLAALLADPVTAM